MTQYDRYINDVVSGKQLSCEYVKKAVKRHVDDIEKSKDKDYPYYFDRKEADKAIKFVKAMRHTKGEYQDQFFKLMDWQAFITAAVFGWKRKNDGLRRFRKVYTEVARKNGKTEWLAAIGNRALIADGEKGAEVFSCATTLSQSSIVFRASKYMMRKLKQDSERVNDLVEIQSRNMHVMEHNAMYEPLAADSDKLDGLSCSMAIVDEYGAHRTSDLLKVLELSMGSRRQPLLWIITTAYFDKNSPCYKFREVCINILDGVLTDETLFTIIYTLDDGDDWENPNVWIKPNPSLGLTPYQEYMDEAYVRAKNEGMVAEIQFKTKNLNIWTNTGSTWIPDDVYMDCYDNFTEEDLLGQECYGGLDLASERDIAAYVLYFPEQKRFLEYYFCPQAKIDDRGRGDGVDYVQWAADGWIIPTEGDWIDQNFIQHYILESMQKFVVKEINYDAWGASKMVQDLIAEGAPFLPFRQGFKSMSPPTKELNNMINRGDIRHNGNPVTRWMMSNVYLVYDPTLAVKIDKSKSSDKVDGAVALVMAIGGWMEAKSDEYYEGEGVYTL